MDIWEDLKHIYLSSLAVRDLPEETQKYVDKELEKIEAEKAEQE